MAGYGADWRKAAAKVVGGGPTGDIVIGNKALTQHETEDLLKKGREENLAMKQQTVLLFALLLPLQVLSAEIEMPDAPLALTFAADEKLCAAAEKAMAAEPPCRAFDDDACPRPDTLKFKPIASDQYGYSEVALGAPISSAAYTVLYLQRYRGDTAARLMETWKVDTKALQKVFDTPPGLITFEDRYKFHPTSKSDLPSDTNARELRDLLKASEKISNEWSATTDLLGAPYAVIRECRGGWRFGGYYRCERVSKMTFVKLSANEPAARACEFAVIEPKE